MIAYRIIQSIMAVCLILGAADFLLKNRFGFGEEFQKGIYSAGTLLLCMAGYLAVAPLAAKLLGPLLSPLCAATGLDPSMLAGLIFANDSGGAALAMQLCEDRQIGLYNGYIVGATIGTTVMYNIGLSMSNLKPEQKKYAVYGVICGVATVPISCLTGALVAGFPMRQILFNTIPLLVLAVTFLLALLFAQKIVVFAITLFGNAMAALSIIVFVIDAVQSLCGITILPGLEPLSEIYPIVGGIALFLGGAYPLMALVQRLLRTKLRKLGKILGANDAALQGMILSTLNSLPSLPFLTHMNPRGIMLNLAFWTSAACVFGDHLAYTSQQEPSLLLAVLAAKITGGILAVLLALFLDRGGLLCGKFAEAETVLEPSDAT